MSSVGSKKTSFVIILYLKVSPKYPHSGDFTFLFGFINLVTKCEWKILESFALNVESV